MINLARRGELLARAATPRAGVAHRHVRARVRSAGRYPAPRRQGSTSARGHRSVRLISRARADRT